MTVSTHHIRRDRGVALPSPVAALSVVAIVAAAIAFAVTGFKGNGNQVVPNAAPTTASVSATVTPTPTATATQAPAVDKATVPVSVLNAGTVTGLAAKVADKAKAAHWALATSGPAHGSYTVNQILYPAKYAAAARQLGLDLGITQVSQSSLPTISDRVVVIVVTPLS